MIVIPFESTPEHVTVHFIVFDDKNSGHKIAYRVIWLASR
jgi:hypothetical protein